MAERPTFVELQRRLAAHLRDPEGVAPPPGVDERRLAVYRELLYNNMEGFVAGAFPVLRSLYDDGSWQRLVRGFFARHRCRTPLFPEISQEFLTYLQQEYTPVADDPPFLLELAHYEWVELALSVAEEEPDWSGIDPDADLLDTVPVLSPLAWPLRYDYPVHRISPAFRPATPGRTSTYLLVLRDGEEEVCFNEINAVTARLLCLLQTPAENRSGRHVLMQIARELGRPSSDVVVEHGRDVLDMLRRKGAIAGGRSPHTSPSQQGPTNEIQPKHEQR